MTPELTTVVCPAPTDPETEPDRIWDTQKADVARLLNAGVTAPDEISRITCLPLWSVERAIWELETGQRWTWRAAKRNHTPNKMRPILIYGGD